MDFLKTAGSLSLGSRLKRLSDHLFNEVAEIYQRLGFTLNPRFFPLFSLIHTQGPQTVTGAAQTLGITHAAVSKISRDMIKTELLIKTSDPRDERRQLLTLSQQGKALADQMQPIWEMIRTQLDRQIQQQHHNLLLSLDEFEQQLLQSPLSTTVINALDQSHLAEITIIDWDPAFRDAFRDINIGWLQHYFAGDICERDHQQLEQPERYYLAKGGAILFAQHQETIVGCCALERVDNNTYYLSKIGVVERFRNQGIGRKLILAAISKVEQRGGHELCLETSSKLAAANHLYTQMGFRHEPYANGKNEFIRADTFMRLRLR